MLGDFNDNYLRTRRSLGNIITNAKLPEVIDSPPRVNTNSVKLLAVIITIIRDTIVAADVLPCSIAGHEFSSLTMTLHKPKNQRDVITKR